jgi:hypothetical protein
MKNTTTGYNDTKTDNSIGNFLVPSWAELGAIFIISLLVIAIGNVRLLWETAVSTAQVSPQTASQTLQPHFDLINNYLHQEFFGKVAVLVVWAVIGSIAYMIIWSIQSTYRKAKDDVEVSTYVQSTSRQSYWHSKIAHYLYVICAWFVFIVFLLVFLVVVMPLANSLVTLTINSYQYLSVYRYLAIAVGMMMVGLYCLNRLWRTATYVFKVNR